ncbi:MAG: DUF2970 domain-containing protein [Legionellales bacterium]|jgi:di/tricarboxylate transporter
MAIIQIIKSLLAAILGVRSQKEMEEDFSKIDWRWYVLIACILVFILIGLLAFLVKVIIK